MATDDCTLICYGSDKDLCGVAHYLTVYKQEGISTSQCNACQIDIILQAVYMSNHIKKSCVLSLTFIGI